MLNKLSKKIKPLPMHGVQIAGCEQEPRLNFDGAVLVAGSCITVGKVN